MAGNTENGAMARTPEELETLFEDACVMRDPVTLAALFEHGAVLAVHDGPMARGAEEAARAVSMIWEGGRTYVADTRRIMQARDIAVIVADRATNVMRRGSDGAWRYVISLLSFDPLSAKEELDAGHNTRTAAHSRRRPGA